MVELKVSQNLIKWVELKDSQNQSNGRAKSLPKFVQMVELKVSRRVI